MLEELLDYVDENDRVLGTLNRSEIHRQGLPHRAVHIINRSKQGDFLLQRRSMSKDNHPGLWDSSVAGHVDSGETYSDCAVREIQEELGVFVNKQQDLKPCFKIAASPENGMEFCQVFLISHNGPFQPDELEVSEIRWFSVLQIEKWLQRGGEGLTPTFRSIWLLLKQKSLL